MSKDFPGLIASQQVSICKQCDTQEFTNKKIERTRKDDNTVIVKVCKITKKRKEPSTKRKGNGST